MTPRGWRGTIAAILPTRRSERDGGGEPGPGRPDATEHLAALVEGLAEKEASMNGETRLPHDIGAIHFVGIGGIGMSGIAEVLLNHGFTVQGSDEGEPDHRAAGEEGRAVFIGQKARTSRARRSW